MKKNFLALRLKNFLYFLKRKLFFYFRKWNPLKNFLYFRGELPSWKNKKKKNSLKKFLMFRERKLFNHKIRNFLILSSLSFRIFSLKKFLKFSWFLYFLKEKFFLYFGKQNFLILWKAELFSPKNKKFQKWTFKAWKTSYISENGSSSLKLKNLFYITGGNLQSLKKKKNLFLFTVFVSWERTFQT